VLVLSALEGYAYDAGAEWVGWGLKGEGALWGRRGKKGCHNMG
jgi:hypothetical protein